MTPSKKKVKKLNIFISYCTPDSQKYQIREIVEYLEVQENINHVYFWERDCNAGIGFDDYMTGRIKASDVILVFCSELALNSTPVILEMGISMANNKLIIPIFTDFSHIFSHLQDTRGVQYKPDLGELCESLYYEITGIKPFKDPLDKTYQNLEDIRSLRDLFIIVKDSGLPLYRFRFEHSKIKMNPIIISGFLTAFDSFSEEIIDKAVIDVSLEDFTISSYLGKHSKMYVISKGTPSDYFRLVCSNLIDKFESLYNIDKFDGIVRPYNRFTQEIEYQFYSLVFNPHILTQKNPLGNSEMEKIVYKTAKIISKNHDFGFFYLLDLIKSTAEQFQKKPEQIYKEIRKFVKENIFLAVDEPQKAEHLQIEADELVEEDEFTPAIKKFQRLYQINKITNNSEKIIDNLLSLGICESHRKNYESSFHYLSDALDLVRNFHFKEKEIQILYELGLMTRRSKDFSKSIKFFNQSYDLIKQQQLIEVNFPIIQDFIDTLNLTKDYVRTIKIIQELLSILRENSKLLANLKETKGLLLNKLGKYQESIEILDTILKMNKEDSRKRFKILMVQFENSKDLKNQNLIKKYRKLALKTASNLDYEDISKSLAILEPQIDNYRDYFEIYIDRLKLDRTTKHEFWQYLILNFDDVFPVLVSISPSDDSGRFKFLFEKLGDFLSIQYKTNTQ